MLSLLTLSTILKEYDSKPFYSKIIVPQAIITLRAFFVKHSPGDYLNAKEMTSFILDWQKYPQLFSKLNFTLPNEFIDFLNLLERLNMLNALTSENIHKIANCHKTAAIQNVHKILDCVSDINTINYTLCHLNKSSVMELIVVILNNSKLLSVYKNHIATNDDLPLQELSELFDSLSTIENNAKVIMGGLTTVNEILLYLNNKKTVQALTQLFNCMKKHDLLNFENIIKILKYTNDKGIIDLVKELNNSPMQQALLKKSLHKEPKITSIGEAWKLHQIVVSTHQRFLIENCSKLLVRGKDPLLISSPKKIVKQGG